MIRIRTTIQKGWIFLIISMAIVFFLRCGGDSSSQSASEYKLKPGDITVSVDPTSIEGFNISYNGILYQKINAYAIIYKKKVSGIDYIGIAACEDGLPLDKNGVNLKIVFQSTDIPSEITLVRGSSPGFGIRLSINTSIYELSGADDSITFTFSGPDSNNVYTIRGKSGNESISVGGNDLTISEIRARYVAQ
ncbi:MAG: hypothetical protein N2316_01340 [Spirochaetes bacterium]|nr:hypothetical protein [Spirochaetota bacterium]